MPVQIVIERSRLSDFETLGEKCNGRNINIHAIVCQSYIARDTCPFTPMQSTDLSGWNILPVLNRKANRPNNPINTVSTKSVTESDKQAAGISPFGQMCVGPRPRFRRGEVWTQKLKSHLLRTQSLKVFPLKPTVSQYIAIHATLTARDFLLISTLPAHSSAFFPNLSRFFPVFAFANTGSCVGVQNKIGHPVGCTFPC